PAWCRLRHGRSLGLFLAGFAVLGLRGDDTGTLGVDVGLHRLLGRCLVDSDHQRLGVRGELCSPGDGDVRGVYLGTGLGLFEGDLEVLWDVERIHLDLYGVEILRHQRTRQRVTGDVHRNIHSDLLTALDDEEVRVLDVVLQRMHGDRFGERELALLVTVLRVVDVERDDRVLAVVTNDTSEIDGGQREVPRIGAVTVQHRGDLTGTACTAGSALTELGTLFCRQAYLGQFLHSFTGDHAVMFGGEVNDARSGRTVSRRVDHVEHVNGARLAETTRTV